MQIKELYQSGRPVVSFEVFPPKKDSDIEGIYAALRQITAFSPDFISVTYGAGGGGNVNRTAEIASFIQNQRGVNAIAHLTCVGAGKARIHELLDGMRAEGIENILALRGDLAGELPADSYFRYAEDLIGEIRERGDFCIGAACYPEGHIDCESLELDTEYLRRKQDAGADFLITQLFFDNDYFFSFLDRAKNGGVTIPVSAGVMPFLSRQQIERMIFLCGSSLPSGIIKLLHKYENNPADLRKAGIEYAAKQVEGLVSKGVDGVHIYSMNHPDIAEACMRRIGRV